MSFNIYSVISLLISIFTSLIVAFCLIMDEGLRYYLLPLLPITFALGNILFISIFKYIFKNIVFLILLSTYYIRMVIIPFLMMFSNYSRDGFLITIYSNIDIAIFLIIYEFLFVLLIITIVNKVNFNKKPLISMDLNAIPDISKNGIKVISIISFFVLAIIIVYPQVLNNYKLFIPTSSEATSEWYLKYLMAINSVPPYIFYLTTWLIDILKNIWVLVLIFHLRKSKMNSLLSLLISISIVLLNAIITSGNTAYSIYYSLALLILLAYLYPKMKRIILLLGLIIGIIAVWGLYIISSISSINNESVLYRFSNTIQAYFSGPINVAASIPVAEVIDINMVIGDFLRSLPIIKVFFVDFPLTTTAYNEIIYGGNQFSGGQIIPNIGLGYIYFGILLSPIFSIAFVYFSIKYAEKAVKTIKLEYKFYYQFVGITLACMPILYNYYIFLIGLFTYIIPTWVFIRYLLAKNEGSYK